MLSTIERGEVTNLFGGLVLDPNPWDQLSSLMKAGSNPMIEHIHAYSTPAKAHQMVGDPVMLSPRQLFYPLSGIF